MSQTNFELIQCFVFQIGWRMQILNVPQLVIYLCWNFFNTENDQWDAANVNISISIKNANVKRLTYGGFRSAFLKNVAKNGKHIWMFNIIHCGYRDMIGIAPFKAVMCTDEDLCCFQCHGATYFQMFSSKQQQSRGIFVCDGDIIEMSINFESLIVCFKKNYELVCARKIIKAEYVAGVTLSEVNAEIKLISYIHSVSC